MARFAPILSSFLLICPLLGDVVELDNGDRLTGTIQSLGAGELLISTSYASDIKIDFSQVTRLVSDTPLVISLEGTEPVETTFTLEGDTIELSTPSVQSFQRGQLLGIDPITVPEPDPNWLQGWSGGADFGWVLATGNSDLKTISFTINPVRETSTDKTSIDFRTLNSEQDGVTSADQWSLLGRYDRTITDGLFAYGLGNIAADAQQDLDLRTRQGGGLGYNWKPSENATLSFYGGVNAIQEKFVGMDRLYNAEGLMGMEAVASIFGGAEATSGFAYLPLFGESRYQLAYTGGIRLPVIYGFTFGFNLTDDYDSAPPTDAKKNDLKFLMTLGYKF